MATKRIRLVLCSQHQNPITISYVKQAFLKKIKTTKLFVCGQAHVKECIKVAVTLVRYSAVYVCTCSNFLSLYVKKFLLINKYLHILGEGNKKIRTLQFYLRRWSVGCCSRSYKPTRVIPCCGPCFLSLAALFSAHSCLTRLSHQRVMGRHVCSLFNFSPRFIKAIETKPRATTSARLPDGEAMLPLISKHPVQPEPLHQRTRALARTKWSDDLDVRLRGVLFIMI